jgi:hypothetical protein
MQHILQALGDVGRPRNMSAIAGDRQRSTPQLGQMDLIAEILNKRTWVGIAATLRSDGLRIQTF